MEKIKIIELLNRVNKGNIPPIIRYDGKLYNFDKEQDDYMCFIINHYEGLLDNLLTFEQLDKYVEILDVIEENKKIEHLTYEKDITEISKLDIIWKINEIIGCINKENK